MRQTKDIAKIYQAGQALVRKHKYDQAIAKFKRITGSDLHTLQLPGALAEGAAEAPAVDVAALRPVYVQAHVSLAVCYTEKGMFDEAISVLHRAAQIDPQNADALCALGYVYRRSGQVEQAIAAFQNALKCNPQCARAQKSLAFLAMEQGRYEDAINLCREAIKADPSYEQAYIELAGSMQLAGRHTEALEALQQAIALNPNNLEYLLQAIALFRKAGMYEEAVQGLQWAVTVRDALELHLSLAECYLELERGREAREECLRVLHDQPRNLRALDMLQSAYLSEGNVTQALRIAHRLAMLCPLNPVYFFRRAVLYQRLGDIRQAIDNYTRVILMAEHAEADLVNRAREAIELLDGLQLRQILMLASDDPVFRVKLLRDANAATAERGFHLSDEGLQALEQLEVEQLSSLQFSWTQKNYH